MSAATPPCCAILDDYQSVVLASADWSRLREQVDLRVLHQHFDDPTALARKIDDCAIVVATRERTRFDAALFARLPALRLLVTTGARNAAIDLAAASRHGVMVCGTRGWSGHTVDLTFTLMLSLMRNLAAESASFRSGGWQTGIGRSLHGATLGVVGVGNIGAAVATIGRAFGMNVIGWSRSLTPARSEALGIRHAAALPELLRNADVVSLHVGLNDQTRGLIGAAELAMMKPDAFLVNTSRGPVVDEDALLVALRERRIAGAALDVYDQEPLRADHPLRTLDNVLGTPHIGYVTRENYAVAFADVVENIEQFLAGSPVRILSAAAA